ncbi:hypothetical protein QYF61_026795 [Mycteria americana]|uniref:Uncharacterized protein n=1 Tax=Mycteria americana TaxID=33587 RepID=A0AAN7S5K9_MYCAM|nr:hypothetical protein QYF61_026795 [Mycteria americana]
MVEQISTCSPWKGPMLEQFMKNYSLWEGLTLEKFVEDCLLWEGPHAGAGEECEEEGAAETKRRHANTNTQKTSRASSYKNLSHLLLEGDTSRGSGLARLPAWDRWTYKQKDKAQSFGTWNKPYRGSLSSKQARDGDSTTSLGSLFQCLTTLSVKKFFLISNLNLSLRNLRPFPLIVSLVIVESDKVSPQPPFLQAKQHHFLQPLLIRLVLQTRHQLRCPSLDTLQHLHVFLAVRGPKLNTVFEVQPHQCRVQDDNHFPSPAGHMISDTSQDAIGLLGHLGTLLARVQPAVNQHPQVFFHQAAFQPLFPKPVALHGVVVTQVQDLALGLVKPHTTGPSPSIQPVQVPLQSLPSLQQINTPAQLGVICNLLRVHLIPSSR